MTTADDWHVPILAGRFLDEALRRLRPKRAGEAHGVELFGLTREHYSDRQRQNTRRFIANRTGQFCRASGRHHERIYISLSERDTKTVDLEEWVIILGLPEGFILTAIEGVSLWLEIDARIDQEIAVQQKINKAKDALGYWP